LLILVHEDEDMFPFFIDLGAHYLSNGPVQYLTEESLVQRQDGVVYFRRSIESETNMLVFHIGLSVGVR
jgi:hypothetical protein